MRDLETKSSEDARVISTNEWIIYIDQLYKIIIDSYLPHYSSESGFSYKVSQIDLDSTHWGGPYSAKKLNLTIQNVVFELSPHKNGAATKDQILHMQKLSPLSTLHSMKMQFKNGYWWATTSRGDSDWTLLNQERFDRGMNFLLNN